MAVKKFNLPDPGEGLTEAEVTTWKVKVGDTVAVNDIVIEVETAKSLVELPIPFAGTVVELLVAEGDTVDVGAPIITVEVAGADPEPAAPEAGEAEEASGPNLVGYGAKAGSTRRRARTPALLSRGAPCRIPHLLRPIRCAIPAIAASPALPHRRPSCSSA